MEPERRQLEMSRVVNIIEEKGWAEHARSVEADKMYLSIHKNLAGLAVEERRMVMDDLLMIVKVFGWAAESQHLDEDKAKVRLVKSLLEEEHPAAE